MEAPPLTPELTPPVAADSLRAARSTPFNPKKAAHLHAFDLAGARIAIVMMSAIGDAVHVLPVINALKRSAPGCHVAWVLQPGPAALVEGHRAVDRIVRFDPARGWRGMLEVRRALAEERFDLVLDLQVALKAGLITAMTPARMKLGFDRARARDANWLFTTHRIPPHAHQHVQDQYFEFLDALGVPREPPEWGLGPWPEERAWQREFFAPFDRPVVALNVGTSNPDKDWLPERWAALAAILAERHGLQPVIVGGRSPAEEAAAAVIQARTPAVSALGSGLRRLVSVLDGSALVVALDSAPLHISVALDRPVIALMGSTDPNRTGPYRRFRDLVVDAFHDPGERASFEGEPVVTTRKRPGRMPRITVDEVAEKVELWSQLYREER